MLQHYNALHNKRIEIKQNLEESTEQIFFFFSTLKYCLINLNQ